MTHFYQLDPRWKNRILGRYRNIGAAGCFITCIAMILTHELGREITPIDIDTFLDKNGGYRGDDAVIGQIIKYANSLGLEWVGTEEEYLTGLPLSLMVWREGHYPILEVWRPAGRHFVVLNNLSGSMNDPGRPAGSKLTVYAQNYVPVRLIWFTSKETTGILFKDLQKMLKETKEKAYDPGLLDGIIARRTRKAIQAFQYSLGMEVSGIIDNKLIKALSEYKK